MAEGDRTVKCEKIQCQVQIDDDVANVMVVSTITDGKVIGLEMRIEKFKCHDNG